MLLARDDGLCVTSCKRFSGAVGRCTTVLTGCNSFIVFWGSSLGLLFTALASIKSDDEPITLAHLKALGIGKPIINQAINLVPTGNNRIAGNLSSLPQEVIVANLPQLLISLLYLLYNDLFTRMYLTKEWMGYGETRKSLRVSDPRGEQRSSRFLQLPLIYSIILISAMTVLHWLVSQSLFVSVVQSYNYVTDTGTPTANGYLVNGVGWSPYALILALIVGGVLIIGLWLTSLLVRYPKGMPLVRSCSAAISAACHPEQKEEELTLGKLMWGVTRHASENGPGHACFSLQDVDPLVEGAIYR
jgi:hypothetical protein